VAQAAFESGQGLASEQVGEHRCEAGEADGITASQGCEAKILSEGGFADAALATQEHVLSARDKIEGGVKMFVKTAVDGTGMVPVEVVESDKFAKSGEVRARDEVATFALTTLHLDELFANFERPDPTLGGVLEESAQCGQGHAKAELLQLRGDIIV
jgi:hypothetical protein